MDIYNSIGTLKGVGKKTLEKFNRASIFNILDLLLYFPRDYEYLNGNVAFEEIREDEKQILSVKAIAIQKDMKTRTRKTISMETGRYV